MHTALLTVYVLVWPVLVAGVLGVISYSFAKEWLHARRTGRDLV